MDKIEVFINMFNNEKYHNTFLIKSIHFIFSLTSTLQLQPITCFHYNKFNEMKFKSQYSDFNVKRGLDRSIPAIQNKHERKIIFC